MSGSGRRVMGRFERAAVGATSHEALHAVVISLAKAVDGVRTEISANTETVDELCQLLKDKLNA